MIMGFPFRSRNCLGRDLVCIRSPEPPAKITAMFIFMLFLVLFLSLSCFLFVEKHYINLVSVALVAWRKVHKLAVRDTAKFLRVGWSFERVALENDVFVGHHNALGVLFVEPRTVRMHIQVWIAEDFTDETEHWEDAIVQHIVARLCHSGVSSCHFKVYIHR